MHIPYIYTSEREIVRVAASYEHPKGVVYEDIGGEHAIWAARVPFLPAMMSNDFTRLGRSRIPQVMERQYRFIYDLARARENQATFELRFIANPNPIPGQPNLIDMVFLGKVFSTRQRAGHGLAVQLWDKFVSNFPLEDPFNYPLVPILDEEDFWRVYEPIPFDLIEAKHILEIRKYEEMPIRSGAPVGRVERLRDYIAHPFVPNDDFNPMARFFVALATQPQRCFAGISIRPTRMFDQEVHNLSFMIGQFKKTAKEDDDVTEEYIRTRASIGRYVYQKLIQEREQLVMVRVHLVGEFDPPRGLAEALGSEMMGNVDNLYPTQWVAAQPADERELAAAQKNIRFMEHDLWGHTLAASALERLRYLATAAEASGAFRLPVPPESGYMPGILVKDEPFVAPADELELRQQASANLDDPLSSSEAQERRKKINLGIVYHRGNPTAQQFQLNVTDLTRHALIAGSTGSGKSTTIMHILAQLWQKHRIPFLVLYPIDKPDYRELRGLPSLTNELLIFTLGDESTSPFRFNPFEVPNGILLKTHLSRLMSVFMAAFSLYDPLPMIYREALRQVYRQRGWDTILERGAPGRDYPIMSDFLEAIKKITESLKYGREVQDNVRQASVIRISDLLENAGYVVNVQRSMPLSVILNQPTVMEIGRVGSAQDTALLMGFLLMRFAEEVEQNPRPKDSPHITVVEEAHRLMADSSPSLSGGNRQAASEDFSNILAEVRGYGEGIIIAEQIPTLLVKGAIGNTYLKLMHWLEDAPSFDLFSNIMNLGGTQREYARTLLPGFAIARSPYGRPVHIKIPEFGDQTEFDHAARFQIDDETIKDYMTAQRKRLGLDNVPVIAWQAELGVAKQSENSVQVESRDVASRLVRAPLRACAFCQPLLQSGQCPHRTAVLSLVQGLGKRKLEVRLAIHQAATITDPAARWAAIRPILAEAASESASEAYCYLAHHADKFLVRKELSSPLDKEIRQRFRRLLREFARYYLGG